MGQSINSRLLIDLICLITESYLWLNYLWFNLSSLLFEYWNTSLLIVLMIHRFICIWICKGWNYLLCYIDKREANHPLGVLLYAHLEKTLIFTSRIQIPKLITFLFWSTIWNLLKMERIYPLLVTLMNKWIYIYFKVTKTKFHLKKLKSRYINYKYS